MIRFFLYIAFFLSSLQLYSQNISIVQINAKWNDRHTVELRGLINAKVSFAYLEEQPKSLQEQIKAVPTIIVFKDGKPVHQWKADLSFKLNVRIEEIQQYIDKL